MKTNQTQEQPKHTPEQITAALRRIDGSIFGGSILYYDDSMSLYYIGPVADLGELIDLMESDDEDLRRDAYSHWCAGCNHGDGYETMEEAQAALGGGR